jgi:hypothetical protein
MRPLALAQLLAILGAGCAAGDPTADAGLDARVADPDGDASSGEDAGPLGEDAGSEAEDAGTTTPGDAAVETDAGAPGGDAGLDGGFDGGLDGGAGGCAGIGAGDTIALDGSGDLASYPSEQILLPFAPYEEGTDQYGITWDAEFLYLTLVAPGLAGDGGLKPLHVYVEAASGALPPASPGTGKEYSGQVPAFAFSPTHLIAVRRISDNGDGPYNGIYEPAASWTTRTVTFEPGTDFWTASSGTAISVRVPWTALGCPTRIRLGAHVVNEVVAEEWKDVLPTGAQPWNPTDGPGSYYEIDLGGDPAVSGWTEVTP